MDFRNRESAATKSTHKTNKTFVKLSEVEGAAHIKEGEMWLKSSKDVAWAPGVSIDIDDTTVISDWVRKIVLCNVKLTVKDNEKGYPELVISG